MMGLIEQAATGAFPLFTFCAFEVLERCSEERSGPNLEKCPDCPLFRWCHEDRLDDPQRPPKAKLADGHYSIDSLIQKIVTTSIRIFEADYLCKRPKADGIWFPEFDGAQHVSSLAEYRPYLPVWLAIDTGVQTGAVFFQVADLPHGYHEVNVFSDYLSEGLTAETNARAIAEVARSTCNGLTARQVTDPAGKARNAVGPAVITEYQRSGFPRLEAWPMRPVADGLALIDSFLSPAVGQPQIKIHPRCKYLIAAFQGYRRAGKPGQWLDHPLDPQHPHEDLMDALRGGLVAKFPDGRKPEYRGITRRASSLHY